MKKNSLVIDIEQKFDRAGVAIIGGFAQSHSRFANRFAKRHRQVDSRRDLDHFLMPSLHGAIALPQMHEIAVRITEDLHLDVFRPADVPLDEDFGSSECRARFTLSFLKFTRATLRRFERPAFRDRRRRSSL